MCQLGLSGAFVFSCCLIRAVRPSPARAQWGSAASRHMAATQRHKEAAQEPCEKSVAQTKLLHIRYNLWMFDSEAQSVALEALRLHQAACGVVQ